MVTPEFYYTLKYAFHFAENITIDFLPIPDHHVKYRQEKFINKITKYFKKNAKKRKKDLSIAKKNAMIRLINLKKEIM